MPYESPPLRSNDRGHWRQKARETKTVRAESRIVSGTYHISPENRAMLTRPIVVTLVWTVTDHRRRDVGASGPTLKAWIDGMVDAGLIVGDHHKIVAEERLRIEVGDEKSVRVEIEAA